MKASVIILSLILLALTSKAQWTYRSLSSNTHHLYSSGEYVVGNSQAGKLSLNYTFNNKYIISVGYSATFKTAISPTDEFLKSGTNLTPNYKTEPFENNESLHLMLGRVIQLSQKSSVRLILQGGPGISNSRSPEFSLLKSGDLYDYNIARDKKLSLVLNPKLEIPVCCTVGFSVGPMVIVNQNQKYIGAGIGFLYGVVKRQ